jgi:hypothetical protein
MRRLTRPLLILLAIFFLIEAWLWSHLEPIVEWIVARIPLRTIRTYLGRLIRKLPPAAALIVFILPVAALFPLKLLGFWLLAHGQWVLASAVLLLTKLVGLGVTAFVFEVTRPKLLQLAWFRWLYQWVLAVLRWSHQLVAPLRRRLKKLMHIIRSKRTAHALRLLWRIRGRMRGARGGLAEAFRTGAQRAARTVRSP